MARSTAPVVGIVGTFDVANFGDLLFPEIADLELRRRHPGLEIRRYSHRPMSAPPWPYDVRPLDELIATIHELDLLLVGGGHLARFDRTVAPGYGSTADGIPHPTGYWLSPTLVAAAAGVPVAWNAIGVSAGTPAWARTMLAATLEAAEYLSVRDEESLAELEGVAPSAHVRLVPDTAFGIAALLEARASDLASAPGGSDRPYIVVQPSKHLLPVTDALRVALPAARSAGLDILELPISPVLGDRAGILGDLGTTTRTLDQWPAPVELARLIAGAQAMVVHSLHATIVGLAHGVPVFRAAMPTGTKYHMLAGFPGVSLISDAEDLAGAVVQARRGAPSTFVIERLAQLARHWDEIAGLVDVEREARGSSAASRVLATIPGAVADAARQAEEERDDLRRRAGDAEARHADVVGTLISTANRATDLAERVGQIEVELSRERAQGAADRRRAEQEIAHQRREVMRLRSKVRNLQPKAAALDRLRRRRVVRAARAILRAWRRLLAAVGLRRAGSPRAGRSATGTSVTPRQARAMQAALASGAPGSPRANGPLVSVIVLSRNGVEHLRRLVAGLGRTTYRSFEVIVVDNGSTDESVSYLDSIAASLPSLRVIRNADNQAFSTANNAAAAGAAGEYLLFLNNDIEPVSPGWLGRLVDTIERRGATAVGARLVYPRRERLDNAGDRRFADLSLQHRGIGFVAADGVPAGRNLGVGDDPLAPEATAISEVAGATAACLLVRRGAFQEVSGFTEGYVYGTEDVDLCLKLRAAGGTILYDGGAVLWHHEYGTQNAQGHDWKRQNRARNRQLFVDRWAPQVFREVFRDRVLGARRWSEAPLRVAITLTRNSPAAGWGDYYTAHELGDALAALGWEVEYIERHRDRWYEIDRPVDVVIALLDSFDVRRIPQGIVTIAWVRNWTERWVERPWFDEYDIVLASSGVSCDIITSRSTRVPRLMPLATNPDHFRPRPPSSGGRADVLFVGNHWGVPRAVEETLPAVASGRSVAVFGRAWERTPLAPYNRGSIAYADLPGVYANARVVIDDTAGPTLPYGAVNSRVFDALATGTLVVTDNAVGAHELFGDRLPVARDAAELEAVLRWAEAEPRAAEARVARLRELVLEHHTYAHRAQEIQSHLLDWVNAERHAILAGVPDWDQAQAWGDYHFARDLQRQLERAGHPTRVHLLDQWGRAPAARADVAIHLHGLSDHRPRPSQSNVLWIISHPERVTPSACNRYDLVFVASDEYARDLSGRVSVPVHPLHQATDPERFRPAGDGPAHELLFVGNTRGVRRAIVNDLLPTGHDLAVYGRGWTTDLIDPIHVRGEHVDNAMLYRYYASAAIVLSDHWPDMRAYGFIANRVYDALASGAFVVSDHVMGIDDEFDHGLVTYADRDELRGLIDRYVADPESRRAIADRGRAAVLARHTFAMRAAEILDQVAAIEPSRPLDAHDLKEIEAWLGRRHSRLPAPQPKPAAPPGDQQHPA